MEIIPTSHDRHGTYCKTRSWISKEVMNSIRENSLSISRPKQEKETIQLTVCEHYQHSGPHSTDRDNVLNMYLQNLFNQADWGGYVRLQNTAPNNLTDHRSNNAVSLHPDQAIGGKDDILKSTSDKSNPNVYNESLEIHFKRLQQCAKTSLMRGSSWGSHWTANFLFLL